MKDRQNIDDLYYKRLKDVETTPPEAVWENISSRLPEKREKRIIPPIWYRIAGAAAFILLLLNLFMSQPPTTYGPEHQIPDTQTRHDLVREINKASETFDQQMLRSSITLQTLQKDTGNLQHRQNKNRMSKGSGSKEQVVTVISKTQFHPEPVLPANPGVTPHRGRLDHSEGLPSIEEHVSPVMESVDKMGSREDLIETSDTDRFSITTRMAPIYFDNMSRRNATHADFSMKESGGDISLSYGVNIAYRISKKLKIRSGVSKVNLSYSTKHIGFNSAVSSSVLKEFLAITTLASPISGQLTQNLGFIEVPVEVEFLLINKKVNLNLIAGGSTLFLGKNRIFFNSSDFTTDMGEANNLNNLSFSTNVGIGFGYDISSHIRFNLEPTFKYQINTFNTPDLHPFQLGVYSGLSFSL